MCFRTSPLNLPTASKQLQSCRLTTRSSASLLLQGCCQRSEAPTYGPYHAAGCRRRFGPNHWRSASPSLASRPSKDGSCDGPTLRVENSLGIPPAAAYWLFVIQRRSLQSETVFMARLH